MTDYYTCKKCHGDPAKCDCTAYPAKFPAPPGGKKQLQEQINETEAKMSDEEMTRMTVRDETDFAEKAREALKEIRLVCRLEGMHAEEAGGLREDGPEHVKRSLSLNRWIARKCADVLMTKDDA